MRCARATVSGIVANHAMAKLLARDAKVRARSLCDSTWLDCRECLELLFLALIAFNVFWLLAAVHRSLVAIDTGWRVPQCRYLIPRIFCDAAHKTEGAVAILDASLRCVDFRLT